MAEGFQVLGKTFVAGEYAALLGEWGLVCVHEPSFVVSFPQADAVMGIPEGSPADVLLKRSESFKKNKKVEKLKFEDPTKGMGGIGASTAQFVAAWSYVQDRLPIGLDEQSIWGMLESYWSITDELRLDASSGLRPSGADLVAQAATVASIEEHSGTQFVWVHRNQRKILREDWPFPNVAGVLVHTGIKLKTHEHLAGLTERSLRTQLGSVQEILLALRQSWIQKNDGQFLTELKRFDQELDRIGFRADHTKHLQKLIQTEFGEGIVTKGCGAMGSDVLLILGKNQIQMLDTINWLKEKKLQILLRINI